jgi:hypothetical protein
MAIIAPTIVVVAAEVIVIMIDSSLNQITVI